jgi:hypothetical protein
MSDDDLWAPSDPTDGSGKDSGPAGVPTGPVTDETQPITGVPSAPPATPQPMPQPTPPGPSYDPGSGPGAVPPPQNPYAQQQSAFGGPPLAPPPNPYQAPHEYAPPQSPYGAPAHPAYAGGMRPDHPSATTSMVLGIVGLVGILFCGGVTLLLSPAAWIVGAKAVREIDAAPGQYGGRDRAQAGKIMGIIGTVLLIVGVVAVIGFIVLIVAVGTNDSSPIYPDPTFQNG